jgi:hypothetical protein
MDRIFIESEFQYALSQQICKCLKFRASIMYNNPSLYREMSERFDVIFIFFIRPCNPNRGRPRACVPDRIEPQPATGRAPPLIIIFPRRNLIIAS